MMRLEFQLPSVSNDPTQACMRVEAPDLITGFASARRHLQLLAALLGTPQSDGDALMFLLSPSRGAPEV